MSAGGMPPARWKQIEDLYRAAYDCDPRERANLLAAAEPGVRSVVESLLSDRSRGGLLEGGAAELLKGAFRLERTHEPGPAVSLAPGTVLGPYTIVDTLGEGGMGAVYRAREARLDRDVAIKVLAPHLAGDEAARKRLVREARTVASLSHPNIAAIYGIEERDGVQALVLELVEGPTLEHRLAGRPLPLDDALSIARQIADALDTAHQHGVVHRDLKPSNIKVREDGKAKVLDFGLAKDIRASRDAGSAAMTATGVIVGTVAYMSPEQARGYAVDTRTDIWGFGCVLYEMLTGKRAFAGNDKADILAAVLTSEPDWSALPAGTPPIVQAFLRQCLQKDPRRRLRDIGDVRLALEGAFEMPALPVDAEQTRRKTGRQLAAWVAGAIAIAALTGVVVWRTVARPDTRTMSFVIHAPEGAAFGEATMEPYPALSPDGRFLVFRAPLNSASVLWIQELGQLRARPLPGTEGAGFPFWSPDGQFIGFQRPPRLYRVAASGANPPHELCACDAGYGGSWAADGTIIVASPAGGLTRVSPDGRGFSALTRLDASRGEFSHRFPVFLPDGLRFLYLVRSTQGDHRGVYLGALDDPALKQRVLPDDANAALGRGSDGRSYLFFARDSVLLAQPFDMSRGEAADSPTVIARPVVPGEGGRFAPFAVSGRTLVYRRVNRAENRLVWVNRAGFPENTVGDALADYGYPALAPDGSRVAATRFDYQSGKNDIWLLDTHRPVAERLTDDPVEAIFPTWMPDGTKVVFASPRAGPWDLYSRSATGSGAEEALYHSINQGTKYPRDVTRDGRFLLYQGDDGLWILPLFGERQPYRLLQARDGRVSPDGRWLAYMTDESGSRQVYVTAFPEPVDQRWRISVDWGEDPQWSRDGRELYYVADRTLMAVPVSTSPAFTSGTPKPLFRVSLNPESLAFGSAYAVAPDGQRFLVNEHVRRDEPVLTATINWTLGQR